jgi:hypothetical protein
MKAMYSASSLQLLLESLRLSGLCRIPTACPDLAVGELPFVRILLRSYRLSALCWIHTACPDLAAGLLPFVRILLQSYHLSGWISTAYPDYSEVLPCEA